MKKEKTLKDYLNTEFKVELRTPKQTYGGTLKNYLHTPIGEALKKPFFTIYSLIIERIK